MMNSTRKLRQISSDRWEDILECIPLPAYIIDVETFTIIHTNNRCKTFLYSEHLRTGKCYRLLRGQEEPCDHCHILKYKANNNIKHDVSELFQTQSNTWHTVYSTIFKEARGRALCLSIAQRNLPQGVCPELTDCAHVDEITGLLNNRGYELEGPSLVKSMLAAGWQAAVIALKIEGLHQINAMYGSAMGDEAIKKIAQAISCLLPREALFARRRGNEFSIVCPFGPNSTMEDVRALLDEIGQTPKKIAQSVRQSAKCKIHLGVCMLPEHGNSFARLNTHAWEAAALHATSGNSTPYTFYNTKLFTRHREVRQMKNDLLLALRCNELELFFQPKYDARTSRIVGAEALLRWNHPTRGRVKPSVFIPVAEESYLIPTVDEWVILESCRVWRKMMDAGCAMVPLSINISPQKLYQQDIVERLLDARNRYAIDPELLEVELTERSALQNIDSALEIMQNLRQKGFRISLDDFGTGYSSLNYLRMLPFDTIKLDRSFISDTRGKTRKAFMSIVSLLKIYETQIVAEGVETREQLSLAKQAGCHLIQGYYFSKPVSFARMKELLMEPQQKTFFQRMRLG